MVYDVMEKPGVPLPHGERGERLTAGQLDRAFSHDQNFEKIWARHQDENQWKRDAEQFLKTFRPQDGDMTIWNNRYLEHTGILEETLNGHGNTSYAGRETPSGAGHTNLDQFWITSPTKGYGAPMRSIATSILCVSCLLPSVAIAQPEPEKEAQWESIAIPRIKAQFDEQVRRLPVKPSSKTVIFARGYLEKDGSVKHLRIDRTGEKTNLPRAGMQKLERALLNAIQASTPLPYGNRPDSLLKHVGLYVSFDGEKKAIGAGMTHPEDYPGP